MVFAGAAAWQRVRRQRLTTPPNGGTEIVPDFGLDQQFLEHLDDAQILFGRALHVATAPFFGDNRFSFVASDLAMRLLHVAFVAHNDDGHAVATDVNNLYRVECGARGKRKKAFV